MLLQIMSYIPDTIYLRLMYWKHFHRCLNLKHPKTYNEKLQWLKLNDRNPIYTTLVDKLLVKEYVSNSIGNEYVVPLLGVWDYPEDVDFSLLPDSFVLKWNHDSGSVVICKNKKTFDTNKAIKTLKKGQNANGYLYGREWPYKNVKPKIIAEEYLEDKTTGELKDYKFFCFNGEPRLMFIASNRFNLNKDTTFDFFDCDFNHLDIENGHPNSTEPIEKPINFEMMIKLAKQLSAGIPHVRVDFYEVNGRVYFGEYTFFHYSGFVPFKPDDWDTELGKYIKVPFNE